MGFKGMTQNVILCTTDTTLHFKNKLSSLPIYLHFNLQLLLCKQKSQRHRCFYQAQRDCSTLSSDIIYFSIKLQMGKH